MTRTRGDLIFLPADAAIRGEVELIADHEHLRRVVQEGMLRATVSLDIATADFKAMLVPPASRPSPPPGRSAATGSRGQREAPSIIEHLLALAARGVEVRVLHAGVPSGPALQQLKVATRRAALQAKPLRGGGGESGGGGGSGSEGGGLTIRRCPRLHAKAVVVDADWLYLGSANLTGAGLGAKGPTRRNFEWGVISHTPAMIDAVLGRFNTLWEGENCAGCGRRDVCPVPLEEPDL